MILTKLSWRLVCYFASQNFDHSQSHSKINIYITHKIVSFVLHYNIILLYIRNKFLAKFRNLIEKQLFSWNRYRCMYVWWIRELKIKTFWVGLSMPKCAYFPFQRAICYSFDFHSGLWDVSCRARWLCFCLRRL